MKVSVGTVVRFVGAVLLAAFLVRPDAFAPVFAPLTRNGAPPIYRQANLLALAWSHFQIVVLATAASTLAAVSLGILVTRRSGAEFLPLSRAVVNVGQTFPPVAVLALTVPLVGFGDGPTFIALFAYGLLPIFENTLVGIQQVPAAVTEAARGCGMTPVQRLFRVELPLALPQIMTGIRLAVVVAIGTATIGSTVAAKGLGEVIIAGLLSDNTAFIVQGGLVVALMAALIYDAMLAAERTIILRLGLPANERE
jgi:osmoprotectant transport system permease protein